MPVGSADWHFFYYTDDRAHLYVRYTMIMTPAQKNESELLKSSDIFRVITKNTAKKLHRFSLQKMLEESKGIINNPPHLTLVAVCYLCYYKYIPKGKSALKGGEIA